MEIPAMPDQTQRQYLNYGIGNTPLHVVTLTIQGIRRTVHLKLEGLNPTHSMKDRTACALLHSLEGQGKLHKGSTVAESTSGNLGVALARLCQLKGYNFLAVVDPKTTDENLAKLRAFGAHVEMVRELDTQGGYLLTRQAYVQHLLLDHPDYVWTDQYTNPANPAIHYHSTGPEIYEQMHHQVDALFIPVSTGGTLAGIGRFFRGILPSAKIIGVDAVGSVIFGTPSAPRKLTGIGSSRPSTFLHEKLYDEFILIHDEEAFAFCRFLFSSTDISVGGSSGAALAACARYLAHNPAVKHAVCVCADRGENYISSIFNDTWLHTQRIELSSKHIEPVEEIQRSRNAAIRPFKTGANDNS